MLFCDDKGPGESAVIKEPIPMEITETVILAAQNYVDVCCQHVIFLVRKKQWKK